jgi:hypothetical protein
MPASADGGWPTMFAIDEASSSVQSGDTSSSLVAQGGASNSSSQLKLCNTSNLVIS